MAKSEKLTIKDSGSIFGTRPWVDDLNHANNKDLLGITIEEGDTGQLDDSTGEIIRARSGDSPATYTISYIQKFGTTKIEVRADDGGNADASVEVKVKTGQYIKFQHNGIEYVYYRHPDDNKDRGNDDPDNGGTRDGKYYAFVLDHMDIGHADKIDYLKYKILYITSFASDKSFVYYSDSADPTIASDFKLLNNGSNKVLATVCISPESNN